jgi:uncharacterized protein (TIGR00730 family)
MIRSLCVYCGSGPGTDPAFAEAARQFGRILAENRVGLVYGGGSLGLMGTLATSVLDHGGRVTGVIPEFLTTRERKLTRAQEVIVTHDMHERKRIMFERSDAFVALPGGIGTLEEVVEMMTWAQLDQHEKPILIVNINGFWDPLIAQFGRMTGDGFLHKEFLGDHVDLPVRFCGSAEAVVPTLQAAIAAVPRPELEESRGVRAM